MTEDKIKKIRKIRRKEMKKIRKKEIMLCKR